LDIVKRDYLTAFLIFRDKLGTFVEGLGCSSPGLVFLTVGLSRPFRRLERYAGESTATSTMKINH